jgi:hypothetical protein
VHQVKFSFRNVQRKELAAAFSHPFSNTMYGFSHELIAGCIIELFCKTFVGFIKDEFEYRGHPNEIGRQLAQFAVSECPTDEFQKKRAIELRVKQWNIRLCQPVVLKEVTRRCVCDTGKAMMDDGNELLHRECGFVEVCPPNRNGDSHMWITAEMTQHRRQMILPKPNSRAVVYGINHYQSPMACRFAAGVQSA